MLFLKNKKSKKADTIIKVMYIKLLFLKVLLCFFAPLSEGTSSITNAKLKPEKKEGIAQSINLEEFILELRNEEAFTNSTVNLFKTEAEFCFDCTKDRVIRSGKIHTKGICEVITQSKTCKSVDKKNLMNCDNLIDSTSFDTFSLLAGCSIGLFNAVKGLLSFVWNVVKGTVSKGTWKRAGDYLESTNLYIINEYDKAYDEASFPFREIKASQKVAGVLADKLYKMIEEYLTQEYHKYGCLNYQARTEAICKVASEFIIPPASAAILLKTGMKGFKPSKKLKDFVRNKKDISLDRKKFAEESLNKSLGKKQMEAVEKAHLVGKGEKGANGKLAGVGNYTKAHIRKKAQILKKAGFSKEEVRKLMQDGVVGLNFGFKPKMVGSLLYVETVGVASKFRDKILSVIEENLRDKK